MAQVLDFNIHLDGNCARAAFENDVSAFSSAGVRGISAIDRARMFSEKRGRKRISRGRFKTIADAVAEMSGRSRKMGHF